MSFEEFMSKVLYTLATVILPLLTTYIVIWLKVKIKEHSTKLNDEQLKKYIDAALDALEAVVVSVNQTYVDRLKQAGKFDKEAQETAKNMALEKAKELITEESKKAIEILYSDFEEYLESNIEAMVRNNKI